MQKTTSTKTLIQQQAKECALKVGLGSVIFLAVLWTLGLAIEHRQQISEVTAATWEFLLQMSSLNGHFWGSITTGFLGLATCIWAMCTCHNIYEKDKEVPSRTFFWIGFAGMQIFFFRNSLS
jgi:hypothetical protein